MDEKLFPDTSSYYKKSAKRPRGILLIVLLLILLLTGIFVGIRYFGGEAGTTIQGMLPVTPTPLVALSPTPPSETPAETPDDNLTPTSSAKDAAKTTPTAEPTAKGTLDRANLTIAVQNGSGVRGAAREVADYLSGLGYKLGTIGNADSFDYEGVTIQVKATKGGYLDQLKKDLSKEYTVTEATKDLTGATADAVVIYGTE